MPKRSIVFGLVVVFIILVSWMWLGRGEPEVDFNTQIKPILNRECMSCHGGVKSNGGLSFLFEEEAKGVTESGRKAIVEGHPTQSELYQRLIATDPELRMPFEKNPLSPEEIQVFKSWIKQGAIWDDHWAYKKVVAPSLPPLAAGVKGSPNLTCDLDLLVSGKLQKVRLEISPLAGMAEIPRRLALDLTGLPPSIELFEQLGENPDEEKWEHYIRQLIDSPQYGERWAAIWMDLARYSDTKGYERDDARTIWRYRDWLIKSFNEDKRYNQFLIEQIAGDLLPNPTDDQLIATSFHRNTMTNDEGGTDNEEFRIAAVMDRVNTTWETVLGTSFSCVQCHSHPYDPIRHEDYYRFMAYFNDSRDEDTFDDYPVLRSFDTLDQAKLEQLKNWLKLNVDQKQEKEMIHFVKTWQPSINSLTSDQFVNSELSDTKWLVFRNHSSSRLRDVNLNGENRLIYRYRSFAPGGFLQLYANSLDGQPIGEIYIDDTQGKWSFKEVEINPLIGVDDIYFTYANPNLKDPLKNGLMFDWFYFTSEFPGAGKDQFETAKKNYWDLITAKTEQTPIMLDNPEAWSRTTFVYDRGNWLTPTDTVTPGVPAIMNPLPADQPNNRLGMAYWLVSEDNPLTARVFVNRVWEQLFGIGLVETLEDFGSQGIAPINQELLDHLAWKFMTDFNWSLKSLLSYIVSSATYQQSSFTSEEHLQKDPENRFLSRAPRVRLSAEQIRDQALAISGLLNPELYGPSVMPYQPDRIWNSPYNSRKWIESKDGQQYRRALYTYWKRTSPYPSMLIFDMMAREVCTTRRIKTNTPLQALVTLNDSVYVEAASQFANKMIQEGGQKLEDQINYGYRQMLFKNISPEKLDVLINLYYNLDTVDSQNSKFIDLNSSEHFRKMKIVANAMFNLDEFISKS
ncbi:MAG: DUF1553 domain-containing protein [Saprospiraceae bacterium]|nr:DUF1553 domain-containing protein [Saprospiraceae bacterium]